jgi:hypothetical protein
MRKKIEILYYYNHDADIADDLPEVTEKPVEELMIAALIKMSLLVYPEAL